MWLRLHPTGLMAAKSLLRFDAQVAQSSSQLLGATFGLFSPLLLLIALFRQLDIAGKLLVVRPVELQFAIRQLEADVQARTDPALHRGDLVQRALRPQPT